MAIGLFVRDERMRGIPVGAEVPEEMVKIFKSDTYEEIKREILEGRPGNCPDFEPICLRIDPGSAPAEMIAELLVSISDLHVCLGGNPIIWKHIPQEARSPKSSEFVPLMAGNAAGLQEENQD